MHHYSSSFNQAELFAQAHRIMSPEEFTQVVEAILQGKYSWACVLILRSAGYNPLHYIPYRTYKRLLKEHRQAMQEAVDKNSTSKHEYYANNILTRDIFAK